MNKDDPLDRSLKEYSCEVFGKPLTDDDLGAIVRSAQKIVDEKGTHRERPYRIEIRRRGWSEPFTQVALVKQTPRRPPGDRSSRLVYSFQR